MEGWVVKPKLQLHQIYKRFIRNGNDFNNEEVEHEMITFNDIDIRIKALQLASGSTYASKG